MPLTQIHCSRHGNVARSDGALLCPICETETQPVTTYPRLPELSEPQPDETVQGYGLRALSFVVSTGITATLTDRALELADHVYPIAVSHHDILPVAAEAIAQAHRLILASIAGRQAQQPEQPEIPVHAPIVSRPGGSRVLQPTQPIMRPPAGSAIDVRF